MNTNPKVYAMIVAAGRGSRFGASIPKQYVLLGGQTLLQRSVARLATSDYITDCWLVVASDDDIARTLNFALPVYYTLGGNERWQSVFAGVEAIMAAGAKPSDLILIHDAARPAVPQTDINQVIESAMHEPYGAILAAPVADTLKQSYVLSNANVAADHQDSANSHSSNNETNSINNSQQCYAKRTIDRTGIWQAQTPQVFRVDQLYRVLSYVKEQHLSITDEASAFEYLDLPIRLVEGSRQNIKLTYPDDNLLLTSIIKAQSEPSF